MQDPRIKHAYKIPYSPSKNRIRASYVIIRYTILNNAFQPAIQRDASTQRQNQGIKFSFAFCNVVFTYFNERYLFESARYFLFIIFIVTI
jgi:hypothetical protein